MITILDEPIILSEEKIKQFTEDEAREFLRNNYGTHGVGGNGITRKKENQTLENLILECICQNYYNKTQKPKA